MNVHVKRGALMRRATHWAAITWNICRGRVSSSCWRRLASYMWLLAM